MSIFNSGVNVGSGSSGSNSLESIGQRVEIPVATLELSVPATSTAYCSAKTYSSSTTSYYSYFYNVTGTLNVINNEPINLTGPGIASLYSIRDFAKGFPQYYSTNFGFVSANRPSFSGYSVEDINSTIKSSSAFAGYIDSKPGLDDDSLVTWSSKSSLRTPTFTSTTWNESRIYTLYIDDFIFTGTAEEVYDVLSWMKKMLGTYYNESSSLDYLGGICFNERFKLVLNKPIGTTSNLRLLFMSKPQSSGYTTPTAPTSGTLDSTIQIDYMLYH